ncbi:hypothetical protein [Lutibacter citreus]|uniref:hypothetical protein n=1 Tax=Lutibacter citreus TaxID=2138210 RepID=UPI001C5501C4|nr:hypothetical protein [Lutibacter citreus]
MTFYLLKKLWIVIWILFLHNIKIAINKPLKAIKLYKQSAHVYRELVEENPECLYNLSEVLATLTSLLEQVNEIDAAKEKIEEALQISETLKEFNPSASITYNSLTKEKVRLNKD